jgi:hypothetical protein
MGKRDGLDRWLGVIHERHDVAEFKACQRDLSPVHARKQCLVERKVAEVDVCRAQRLDDARKIAVKDGRLRGMRRFSEVS